ncbi:hypothetical protein [Cohnella abietis]|uniref:hypothetical protein n=1 Tax=Cohnella abietis TaxID=2507935 RepID=UPI00102E937E|nr:hypothetical protein [Cohnella abietis]
MFHPWSLVIPLMILLPNLIFFKYPPQNMPSGNNNSLILTAAEGIGRIGVLIVPVFYTMHIHETYEIISLIVMVLSLLMYYLLWVRYFRNNREFNWLYSPIMGVPVPLAIFPILYFLFSSVVIHSLYQFIFSLIFAVGHIPNSISDYARSKRSG